MITGLFVGVSVGLAFNTVRLWFDKIELNARLKELEFHVDVLTQSVNRMIKENQNAFTAGIN